MRNIFKRILGLFGFVVFSALGLLFFTVKVDAVKWAAAPVPVRFENYDPSLRALLSAFDIMLVHWYAEIYVVDTDGNSFTVPAIVRNIKSVVTNPEDWRTHQMMLFYDQDMPECPEFMKFKEGSLHVEDKLPKIARYKITVYISDNISGVGKLDRTIHTVPRVDGRPFDFKYYPDYCSFWLNFAPRSIWRSEFSKPRITCLEPDPTTFQDLLVMHSRREVC